jgi:hypothetical protein
MPRSRRRRNKKSGRSYTRRAALLLIAGGSTAGVISETGAFSSIEADRTSTTNVAADDGSSLVKLEGFDSSKTYQEPHTVTVTNNTSSTLSSNSATTGGDLELRDVGSSSSTTSYTIPSLDPGESASFEVVTAANETGTVSDTISLSFSNGGSVNITADRGLTVEFKSGGQLVYAVGSGDIRVYDAVNDIENDPPNSSDADVIGANAADIVEGADADIPYLTKGGSNKKDILATYVGASADVSIQKGNKPKLKKQKTRLTLAKWPPATLSGNLILAADGNSSKIIAIDSNGNDEVIANPSNGCGGVSGVADIDGDGSDELVFVDSSQQMRYLEQNGNTVKISNAGVGSNNSAGFGPPVDFNDDGVIRIPFIDGSQNPAVVTASGTKTILNSSGIAKKAAIAPVDIDGDGDPEFMFLGNSSGKIKYIDDVLGSNTVKTLQVDGSPVTPLVKVGLNSGINTQTGSGSAPPSTPTTTPSGGCTVGSNNNPGALQFSNLQGFEAKAGPDRWDIGQIQVQDADNDDDLNKLKFEITDGGSTVRATKTIQLSGQQYQKQNLQLDPDDTKYDVQKNETYTLTATVCDGDGNSNTKTDAATA